MSALPTSFRLGFVCTALLFALALPARAQDLDEFDFGGGTAELPEITEPADIGQSTLPRARVTDPAQIAFLIDRFLIFEDSVSYMEIIDVTRNGFGPDDIAVTFPSQRTHFLGEFVDSLAQSLMLQWKFEAEFTQDAAFDAPPEFFDPAYADSVAAAQALESAALADAARQEAVIDSLLTTAPPDTLATGEARQAAESAILANIMRVVSRNYNDAPISLLFERDSVGFTFQLWDYSPEAMTYVPPPPPIQLIDSIRTEIATEYDLLYLSRADSLVKSDTAYYDILYLYQRDEDTIFVPEVVRDSTDVPAQLRRGNVPQRRGGSTPGRPLPPESRR